MSIATLPFKNQYRVKRTHGEYSIFFSILSNQFIAACAHACAELVQVSNTTVSHQVSLILLWLWKIVQELPDLGDLPQVEAPKAGLNHA